MTATSSSTQKTPVDTHAVARHLLALRIHSWTTPCRKGTREAFSTTSSSGRKWGGKGHSNLGRTQDSMGGGGAGGWAPFVHCWLPSTYDSPWDKYLCSKWLSVTVFKAALVSNQFIIVCQFKCWSTHWKYYKRTHTHIPTHTTHFPQVYVEDWQIL